MSRPHICFLQAQALPWQDDRFPGVREGAKAKVLSTDDETGATTAILRYPPGWHRRIAEHLSVAEEFLVLDGCLELNGGHYTRHGYGFVPPGFSRDHMSSEQGAVVLTMFSGAPVSHGGTTEVVAEPQTDDLISIPDTFAMPWLSGADGSVTGKPLNHGIAVKKLRLDARTGEQSFLYCSWPQHPPPSVMVGGFGHPMIEELFVLDGEYVFADLGVMRPGAYCWWREGRYHGPVGSIAGYHMFIRVHGGELVNVFSSEPRKFRWQPPHDPSLPSELASYGTPVEHPDKW